MDWEHYYKHINVKMCSKFSYYFNKGVFGMVRKKLLGDTLKSRVAQSRYASVLLHNSTKKKKNMGQLFKVYSKALSYFLNVLFCYCWLEVMELLHNIFAILLHNGQNLRICMGRSDFILKAKKLRRVWKRKNR